MSFVRLISILLISVSAFAANLARAQAVDAPVLTAGLRWEFQTTDLWTNQIISRQSNKVLGILGDYARMAYETTNIGPKSEPMKPQTSEATIRTDLNSIVLYRGEKMNRTSYKWPLETGKKWTFQTKADLPPVGTSTLPQIMTSNFNVEVKGWETVDVPAGKFKAIKIVYRGSWVTENPVVSGTNVSTAWYSPEAKTNVLFTYEAFNADGTPQTRTTQQLVAVRSENQ